MNLSRNLKNFEIIAIYATIVVALSTVVYVDGSSDGSANNFEVLGRTSLKEFLRSSSGALKVGGKWFHFPEDYTKLFPSPENEETLVFSSGNVTRVRRSTDSEEMGDRRLPSRPEGHREREREEMEEGFISLGNFFRVGCVFMHLQEIQETLKTELRKREERPHLNQGN